MRSLPARIDPELYAYLRDLQNKVQSIEGSIDSGSIDSDDSGAEDEVSGFALTDATQTLLVSQATGVLDAWTTINAGAPAGTRYARIIFDTRGDNSVFRIRTDSSSPYREMQIGTSTRYSFSDIVTLTDNGEFDYFVQSPLSQWAIYYVGFISGSEDQVTITGSATHNLLDGSVVADSIAASVAKGSLVVGNSTPKWDDLPVGADGTVLTADSTQTLGLRWGAAGAISATTVEVNLGSTPIFEGKFTITDSGISATSKVLCWQAPGPYTGKGTRADEAAIQPVNVVAVEPLSGSAVVYWQTPPMIVTTIDPQRISGFGGTPSTQGVNRDDKLLIRRIGRAMGNVKFSYIIFT